MKKVKREFKGVYVIQNFGSFRGLFYSYANAKRFVKEEGTVKKTGERYYQIYKCDVELKNMIRKNETNKY